MSQNNILDIPRFATEKEEAEWWDNNPDFVLRELQQAKAEGRLGHGTAMRRMAEIEAAKKSAVELDAADLTLANKLAERKGVERQAYLKALIHTALLQEAESLDRTSAA